MIKKLYQLGLIITSLPIFVVAGSTLYTMFKIEPITTALNLCFVSGLVLILISWILENNQK